MTLKDLPIGASASIIKTGGNAKWAILLVAWQCILAWICSFIVFMILGFII